MGGDGSHATPHDHEHGTQVLDQQGLLYVYISSYLIPSSCIAGIDKPSSHTHSQLSTSPLTYTDTMETPLHTERRYMRYVPQTEVKTVSRTDRVHQMKTVEEG